MVDPEVVHIYYEKNEVLPRRFPGESFAEAMQRFGVNNLLTTSTYLVKDEVARAGILSWVDEAYGNDEQVIEFDLQSLAESCGAGIGRMTDEESEARWTAMTDDWSRMREVVHVNSPYNLTCYTWRTQTDVGNNRPVGVLVCNIKMDKSIVDDEGETKNGLFVIPYVDPEDGDSIIPIGFGLIEQSEEWHVRGYGYFDMRGPSGKEGDRWITATMKFLSYVFALMDCKNIAIEDDEPLLRNRQQWRRLNRTPGWSQTARKKIVVYLPHKQKESMSGSGSSFDAVRHMVRGHFRHYTEDKPLFGHYSGVVWVPAFTRGSRGHAEKPSYKGLAGGDVLVTERKW